MAFSKSLVSTVLLAAIFLFSLKVNASRELNQQTYNNKVSNVLENEENNNNRGDTITNPNTGGYLSGNGYPGMAGYPFGNGYIGMGGYGYPGMTGHLPFNEYPIIGGYGGRPGLPSFGNGPKNFNNFPRGGYSGNIGDAGMGNSGGYP